MPSMCNKLSNISNRDRRNCLVLLSVMSVSVLWLQFPGAFVSSLVVVGPNFFHDVFKIGLERQDGINRYWCRADACLWGKQDTSQRSLTLKKTKNLFAQWHKKILSVYCWLLVKIYSDIHYSSLFVYSQFLIPSLQYLYCISKIKFRAKPKIKDGNISATTALLKDRLFLSSQQCFRSVSSLCAKISKPGVGSKPEHSGLSESFCLHPEWSAELNKIPGPVVYQTVVSLDLWSRSPLWY